MADAAPRTIHELLEREWGVSFTPVRNPVTASVGVAVVQILRQNPSRVAAVIVNLSANHVWIAPIAPAATTAGIRLEPNGGSVSMNWRDDGEMVAYEWTAIADGAASAIFVLESNIAPQS